MMGEHILSVSQRDRHAIPPSIVAQNAEATMAQNYSSSSSSAAGGEGRACLSALDAAPWVTAGQMLGYRTPSQSNASIQEERVECLEGTVVETSLEAELGEQEESPRRWGALFRRQNTSGEDGMKTSRAYGPCDGDDGGAAQTEEEINKRQKRQASRSLSNAVGDIGRMIKRRMSSLTGIGRKDSIALGNGGSPESGHEMTKNGLVSWANGTDRRPCGSQGGNYWYISQGLMRPCGAEEDDTRSVDVLVDGVSHSANRGDELSDDVANGIRSSMSPLVRSSVSERRESSAREPAASPVTGTRESRMNSIMRRVNEAEYNEDAISGRFESLPAPDPLAQTRAAESWRANVDEEQRMLGQDVDLTRTLAAGDSARASRGRSKRVKPRAENDPVSSSPNSSESPSSADAQRPVSFLEEWSSCVGRADMPY